MNKSEFLNKLLQMYYNSLNYLNENFDDGASYYEDLNSAEMVSRLYNSIEDFMLFEYNEDKLPHILAAKEILFKNAIYQNSSELYADLLYEIVTCGLDWHLKKCRVNNCKEIEL